MKKIEEATKSKTGMSWLNMLEEMKKLGYDYTGDYSFVPEGYKQKQMLYRFDFCGGGDLKKLSITELKEKFAGRATVLASGSEYAPEQTKILMTNKLYETPAKQVDESEDGGECCDVKVTICTCNDPFQEGNRQTELARIFREMAEKIENGNGCNFKIKDANGNIVGSISDSGDCVNEAVTEKTLEEKFPEITENLKASGKTFDDVDKVYSGKDHACRCGCCGRYFSADDKSISRIYSRLEKILELGEFESIDHIDDAWVDVHLEGNKAYTIYFK